MTKWSDSKFDGFVNTGLIIVYSMRNKMTLKP